MLDRLFRWLLKHAMRMADRIDNAITEVWEDDDG